MTLYGNFYIFSPLSNVPVEVLPPQRFSTNRVLVTSNRKKNWLIGCAAKIIVLVCEATNNEEEMSADLSAQK